MKIKMKYLLAGPPLTGLTLTRQGRSLVLPLEFVKLICTDKAGASPGVIDTSKKLTGATIDVWEKVLRADLQSNLTSSPFALEFMGRPSYHEYWFV